MHSYWLHACFVMSTHLALHNNKTSHKPRSQQRQQQQQQQSSVRLRPLVKLGLPMGSLYSSVRLRPQGELCLPIGPGTLSEHLLALACGRQVPSVRKAPNYPRPVQAAMPGVVGSPGGPTSLSPYLVLASGLSSIRVTPVSLAAGGWHACRRGCGRRPPR